MPDHLTYKQQDLLNTVATTGITLRKDFVLVGTGVHEKADARTVRALQRRRLITLAKNGVWLVTKAGKKVAKPKRLKDVQNHPLGTPAETEKETRRQGPRRQFFDAREIVARLSEEYGHSVDPLEGLLRMAEDKDTAPGLRAECRKAALPYVHTRLNAVEHTGVGGDPIQHEHKVDLTKLNYEELAQMRGLFQKAKVPDADSV